MSENTNQEIDNIRLRMATRRALELKSEIEAVTDKLDTIRAMEIDVSERSFDDAIAREADCVEKRNRLVAKFGEYHLLISKLVDAGATTERVAPNGNKQLEFGLEHVDHAPVTPTANKPTRAKALNGYHLIYENVETFGDNAWVPDNVRVADVELAGKVNASFSSGGVGRGSWWSADRTGLWAAAKRGDLFTLQHVTGNQTQRFVLTGRGMTVPCHSESSQQMRNLLECEHDHGFTVWIDHNKVVQRLQA